MDSEYKSGMGRDFGYVPFFGVGSGKIKPTCAARGSGFPYMEPYSRSHDHGKWWFDPAPAPKGLRVAIQIAPTRWKFPVKVRMSFSLIIISN